MRESNPLKRLWKGWKAIGRKIGDFQARVLLTVLYAIVVLPVGLAVRLFGDPLRIRNPPSQWLDHQDKPTDIEWAHRQS